MQWVSACGVLFSYYRHMDTNAIHQEAIEETADHSLVTLSNLSQGKGCTKKTEHAHKHTQTQQTDYVL